MSNTFLLIDANNLFYRSKYVSSAVDPYDKASLALHTILNMLKSSWNKFNSTSLVICHDSYSWRKMIYPEYKANRKVLELKKTQSEKEEDEIYFTVINEFSEFLNKYTNVISLKTNNAEADDLISEWIKTFPNDNHIIVSSDKDFYQLLSSNVKIYDGIKGHLISNKEILDNNNKPVYITKKLTEKDEYGNKIKVSKNVLLDPPNPEYELFYKIIRGDPSDNIMSAYPGVREKGSSKKIGIMEAFDDRTNQGYNWNSFMQSEWDKLINSNISKVKVLDEYHFNKELIDLSMIPVEIKNQINEVIYEQINKEKVKAIGLHFLRFCHKMELANIKKYFEDYIPMLSSKLIIENE